MSRRSKSFFGTESAQFSELYDPFNVLGQDGKGTGIDPLGNLPSLSFFEAGSIKDDQLRLAMFHRANPTIAWTPANYGAKGSKDITGVANQRTTDSANSYIRFRFGQKKVVPSRAEFVAALKSDTPYADDLSVAGLYADDIQGYEAAANLPPLSSVPGLPAPRRTLTATKPGSLTKLPVQISSAKAPKPSFAMPASLSQKPQPMTWATEVPAKAGQLYREAPPGPAAAMTWATEVPAKSRGIYTEMTPQAPASASVPTPAAAAQQGLVLAQTTQIYRPATPQVSVPAVADTTMYSTQAPASEVLADQVPQEGSAEQAMANRDLQIPNPAEIAQDISDATKAAQEGAESAKLMNKILIGAGIAAAAGAVYYFGFRKKSS